MSDAKKGLQRKILLVEDDDTFRQALRLFLASKKFEVFEAENGQVAQNLLFKNNQYDAIISDIRMPQMQGTELLRYVRCTSQTPFILMTGFSDIMEIEEAYKLGASGFVTKPFKPQDLLEIVNKCFPDTESLATGAASDKDNPLDFCAITIEDFLGSQNLKMDIYIRLTAEKFVKLAHKGSPVSVEQVRLYKSKGVNFLYIKTEEFQAYVNFNVKLSEQVAQNKNYSKALKVQVLKHAQQVMIQNVFNGELDKYKVESSISVVKSTISVLSLDHQIFELVEAIHGFTDHVYAHSLGVSAYSVLIAQAMGWNSPQVLFKLSMGGLLHDIGKREISREILDKPRHQLTKDDVATLETHTFRGKEILSNIPSVPGDVLQIVLQHHENGYGRGPMRLKPQQIHPLAKVVALANRFVELVVRNPSHDLHSTHDAYEKIMSEGNGEFDSACMEGLERVINYKKDDKKVS